MNPFEAYAHKAVSTTPARLIGISKTRAEARARYDQIVNALNICTSAAQVQVVVDTCAADIAQFKAEMEFLWTGDGCDFLGLEKEIEWARARVDDGLDFPRWEAGQMEEGLRI